jgi:cell division protein FtsW
MAVVMRIPSEKWSKHACALLAFSIFLLLAVFFPSVGRRVNGAVRWIAVGPITFQPAELIKLALVVYLAHSLAQKREMVQSFSVGFLPHVMVTGLIVLAMLLQPDFGTSVIVLSVLGLMLFVAGAKISYLVLGIICSLPAGVIYISTKPHAWKRIVAFIEPETYKHSIGYQVWESLVTFGSGGVLGTGMGQGQQKLFFLPEAHTDFVFAIIGEELGFVGVVLIVILFSALVTRGLIISKNASCRFNRYMSFGISVWIGIQALINMLVAVSLLPTKGLTLPLVSFGRSSLVITMIAIGILLRISAEESSIQYARPRRARR